MEESGTKKFLDSLPVLPKKGKIKSGFLYVSYEIDESELDGGIDWPDVGVATVYAILQDGKREYLGEIRAYNWEAIWLSTNEYEEVDDAEKWWKCVKEEYNKTQLGYPLYTMKKLEEIKRRIKEQKLLLKKF